MTSLVFASLDKVGLSYPLLNSHNMNLKGLLSYALVGRRKPIEMVHALSNLDLTLAPGDRVLISGRNGAGKTSLLKLLGGHLHPTAGRIEIRGTCLTLLDFASALDSHLNGLENIHRLGILLGANPQEIAAKVEEIAGFTGLGARIQHPIYTYSNGMKVRLSFSVATSFQRDIVLIDEGLGFADSEFMEKANSRLENFVRSSGILVLASHAPGPIIRMINRHITLEDGVLVSDKRLPEMNSSEE